MFCLPDGSSVQVPHDIIRRSAMLQEAMHASDTAANVSITLPKGVLQDWLQSVDALKALTSSPAHHTDIANDPRLLRYLTVRCFACLCVRERRSVLAMNRGWQSSLLVLLQGQRELKEQHAFCAPLHACVICTYMSLLSLRIAVQMLYVQAGAS